MEVGELAHCPRAIRGADKEAIQKDIRAPAQTPAHIKELTHLPPIPYLVSPIYKAQTTSLNLPEAM